MWESSSSAEVDFLDLCDDNVRSLECILASGEDLLNQRHCKDLSFKLSKTIQNVRELVLYCETSIVPFRPALENLHRYLEKANLALVSNCAEEDWLAAAVFQIQNENAFREILLDVSLCYNAIYELAKSKDWNDPPENLRQPSVDSVFKPLSESGIDEDKQDLKKRLDDLANGYTKFSPMDYLVPGKIARRQSLAKYLLVKMCYTSSDPQAVTLGTYSANFWRQASEPLFTWGTSSFFGSGSGASGVFSTTRVGIPCAKKEFHGQDIEDSFLKEAGILAH